MDWLELVLGLTLEVQGMLLATVLYPVLYPVLEKATNKLIRSMSK